MSRTIPHVSGSSAGEESPGNRLWVVMYHYVRDFARTRFPRIKGLHTSDFAHQVATLSRHHEIASLESALEFLAGRYRPAGELFLLTFDDGLKDHYSDVLPVLAQHHAQGLFFVPTSCLQERRVAAVHKNHFLMAELEFEEYCSAFTQQLRDVNPGCDTSVDADRVSQTYRWDTPEVGAFKYLLNFGLSEDVRNPVLDSLFGRYLGDEKQFAGELYLTWAEVCEMQRAGMVIGGHSHGHAALGQMGDHRQTEDLITCTRLLHENLLPQVQWPFSYPYGKPESFNTETIRTLRDLAFVCSFSTVVGPNRMGADLFCVKRIDPKDVPA